MAQMFEKIITDYIKPANFLKCVPKHSNQPESNKRSLPYGQVLRVKKI